VPSRRGVPSGRGVPARKAAPADRGNQQQVPPFDAAREAWESLTTLLFGDVLFDRFHAATRAAGLPHPGALKALMALDTRDVSSPPSMRSLAASLRCDASYVTALVDDLEGLGFVERRMSPTDRRVKLLHVTPAGRRARQRAHEVITEPPRMFEALTEPEARTLARLLRKIAKAPDQHKQDLSRSNGAHASQA